MANATLEQTYDRLRNGLRKNTRSYEWRVQQLRALKTMLIENNENLNEALWNDLRKGPFECQTSEQGAVLAEIEEALKHLKSWMKPERVRTPFFNWPAQSSIVREPYGLTLVIGAWNYPINVTLTPVIGAIAGGNACLIKPSEISAHTTKLLSELIPRYMDPDLIAVYEADAEQTSQLLEKKFDLIFFTGSTAVGRIVYEKAAKNLTPVILELGGKSPVVVLSDRDLETTARRIAWGKFMNAGQTCIAPDYAIVPSHLKGPLIEALKHAVRDFFGENPKESRDYCRIINERNFDRLANLHPTPHAQDRTTRYMAPTILEADADHPLMTEEIFGPLLPVLTIDSLDETLAFINSRPKPLALYVFTSDERTQSRFENETSSGALVFNDVVVHMPASTFPFGGVGESGLGSYHGRFSFEAFTHAKSVLRKSLKFDVPLRYAPYTSEKAAWLKRLTQGFRS